MWFLFKSSQVWWKCFIFAAATDSSYWPPLSSRLLLLPYFFSMASCCSVIPFFPSILFSGRRSGAVTTRRWAVGSWVGVESLGRHFKNRDIQYRKLSKRTNTLPWRLKVLSQVIPQLVSLRRGEEVRLFTLERICLCLTHTQWNGQRERRSLSPFTSSITQQIGLCLPCSVWCLVIRSCKRWSWQLKDINETHLLILSLQLLILYFLVPPLFFALDIFLHFQSFVYQFLHYSPSDG